MSRGLGHLTGDEAGGVTRWIVTLLGPGSKGQGKCWGGAGLGFQLDIAGEGKGGMRRGSPQFLLWVVGGWWPLTKVTDKEGLGGEEEEAAAAYRELVVSLSEK